MQSIINFTVNLIIFMQAIAFVAYIIISINDSLR